MSAPDSNTTESPPLIHVVNWREFQHYGKRKPPWIKLYRDVLVNFEIMSLEPWERWCLVGLWLIASETDNQIPANIAWLRHRLGLAHNPPLAKLQELGLIEVIGGASTVLAKCYSKTEAEERQRRKYVNILWQIWCEICFKGKTQRVLTAKRKAHLKATWVEHLKTKPEPEDFFGLMVRAMLADSWWGPKPNTHLPEKAFKNAELREQWALRANGPTTQRSGSGTDAILL